MKTKTYKLTLTVEIDPQGETTDRLRRQLQSVIRNAVNNGSLTGDSPATVERWDSTVEEIV